MLRNNNQEIIKKLSTRNFKVNKIRNLVSIIAIVLTTVLFTSLFTVGYSMLDAFNNYKMMQYGMSTHVQIQDVNDEQIKKIKNNELVDSKSIGIVKNIYSAINPEFSTQTVNVTVYDKQSIENTGTVEMIEGSLPKSKDEIVMPTKVLDMLKLPYKVGTEVNITIPELKDKKLTGKSESYKFRLSGYYKYKTTTSLPLHDIYVSEAFYDEYKQNKEVDAMCVTFNFIKSKDLEGQLSQVLSDIQPYSGKATINPVFLDSQANNISEMINNVLPILLMAALILLSGYLLIYNIFYISVVKDINHYGLLKTIGTSPKQIKKLIIKQANKICLITIPIGLALGYTLGKIFIPMVGSMMDGLKITSFKTFSPVIFVFATVFSYITVRISCNKPAKIASNVSPVDAVRYNDRSTNVKRKLKKGKSGSKIYKMAFTNIFRNKRKAYLVLISMSLSCIIFLAVSTIITSSNPERAADGILIGDVEIEHGLAQYAKYEEKKVLPIDNQLIKDIQNIKEVKSVEKIYKDSGRVIYEGDLKEEILTQKIEEKHKKDFFDGKDPREVAKEQNSISLDLTGVSSGNAMKNMIENSELEFWGKANVIQGNLDIDKFNKGGYVILVGHKDSKIKVGDKIDFKYLNKFFEKDGYTENQFEVMAIIDGAENFNLSMYVNENDFKKVVENPYIQKLIVDTSDKNKVAKEVKNLNGKYNNPYTQVNSKQVYIDEARKFQSSLNIIGMSAVFIIGLIGVLNFVNTMITSIISRKTEFAMMEAIGMTKKQLKKMLLLEGLYYGVIITFVNITIGSLSTLLGYNIMQLRFSTYTYPVGSLITCTIALFLVCLIIPLAVYSSVNKDSIIDRIRVTE